MKKLNLLLKLKVLKILYTGNLNLFCVNFNLLRNNLYYNKFLLLFFFNYSNNLVVKLNYLFFNLNFKLLRSQFNQFYLYNNFFFCINCFLKISNYNLKYLFLYNQFKKLNSNRFKSGNLPILYENNLFFFKFFILKYLNTYFKNKYLYLNIQKNQFDIFDLNIVYNLIVSKSKRLMFLNTLKINLKSFVKLILIFFYSKDVVLLKNFVKYILETIHFKKHKNFLYNLKIIFNLISNLLFHSLKVSGIFIKIKGKIGVGGNLKKRIYNLKIGKFSFTKKNQKMNYIKDSIRTYSGVLGFEIYLSYY
jgi:hypothetical protein